MPSTRIEVHCADIGSVRQVLAAGDDLAIAVERFLAGGRPDGDALERALRDYKATVVAQRGTRPAGVTATPGLETR